MTPVVTVLISTLTSVFASVVGAYAVLRQGSLVRRSEVERMLEASTKDRHLLYLWNRQLVDQIWSREEPPPAEPPKGLFT